VLATVRNANVPHDRRPTLPPVAWGSESGAVVSATIDVD
jgi:hypothetical protein